MSDDPTATAPTIEDTNDFGFEGLKKKKKKKVVAFNEDPLAGEDVGSPSETTDAPPAPVEADSPGATGTVAEAVPVPAEDDMFSGLKKKSKKKKEIPADFENGASPAPNDTVTPTGDEDFSDLKKKKSSKKKATFDLEAFEKELDASGGAKAGEGEDEDLGDDPFAHTTAEAAATGVAPKDPWIGSDRDYTYQELLHRAFRLLHQQNPALATGSRRYTIVPPSVHRDGNKKTVFANIADICKRMHRQPEHIIQFLFAELGTSGSVDGSQRLVIKGRFQQKQIENVLRRYIVEYVTCKTCKSPDTILTKENRLYFMTCEACGSRRSVQAIKTGFQAQVGKRRANVAQ